MLLIQYLHFLSLLVYTYMAGYILIKDPKSLLNRICAVLILSFAVWNIVDVFAIGKDINEETAILFQNISSIGWISVASILISFSLVFSKKEKLLKKKWFLILIFILPVIFIYGQWTHGVTGHPVQGDFGWEFNWEETIWSYLFYMYYISFTLASIFIVYLHEIKTKNTQEKSQAKIMVATLIASLVCGTITDVILPLFHIQGIPQMGNVILLFFAGGMIYSIVKYKFLMVTPAIAAENILSTMGELLILSDKDGHILNVNNAVSEILRYDQKELIGKPVEMLLGQWDLKNSLIEKITLGEIIKNYEAVLLTKASKEIPVIISCSPLKDKDGETRGIVLIARDITERKKAEEMLKESEGRVRAKLDAILLPEGDIGNLDLADIVDVKTIQTLMDNFYHLTNIGVAIINIKGDVLVATGWQDICTKFHRVHHDSCKKCIESDIFLSKGIKPGEFKIYKCKNNMWDIATPIIVGRKHVGNLFLGQFLYKDELPDYEIFRVQAREYGFDENEYIAALECIPRWSKETIETVMSFYSKLATILSTLSYSNIKLAQALSEQKRVEEVLQVSQGFLSEIIENNGALIYVKDNKGRYELVNRKWEEVLGLRRETIIGKTDEDLFPGNTSINFRRTDIQVLEQGKTLEKEEMLEDATGKRYFISIKFPLRDKNNEIKGVCGISTEITERKRAEEASIQNEAHLSTLIDTIPDLVWLKDENGVYLHCNTRFENFFGAPKNEIIGKTDYDFVNKELADFFREKDKVALIARKPSINEEQVTYANDGHTEILETIKKAIYKNDGQLIGVLGIGRNITERKQFEMALQNAKEKAEESDRLKSAFLSNMSHEIRTPMNGILGFAELLAESNLTGDQQQEYIRIIRNSGNRMLNIINDIVDLSKIESGQTEVKYSETNINEITNYLKAFFSPEIEQKNIQLYVKNALKENGAIIITDREKVNALLMNLIKNAIKFTHHGSIEFGYHKKDAFLEFYVKDTGVGIPKEQHEIIFERFRQGSESRTRNYEGAGLGLSISKAYANMLGGEIWAESELGKGSAFYFTIPYKRKPKELKETYNLFSEIKRGNQINNLKILIAEDDEISEKLIVKAVEKYSKEVLTARNGVEAVNICRNNPDINLVLMDIKMPELNGIEAIKQIRQFNKEVIIFAQTAYALSGERDKAIEAGCNDFISKPINQVLLMELISKHF